MAGPTPGTARATGAGPLGRDATPARSIRSPQPTAPKLLIHLDLDELIEIDDPLEGRIRDASGKPLPVLLKGPVIQKSPQRPKDVLAVVREKFKALASEVQIELGSGAKANRFLKARFGWPMEEASGKRITHPKLGGAFDPAYVGAGAEARSRTRLETFKPVKGDEKKGVTAYVFEGAVGHVILDFFPGKSVNVTNIFATAIAHELGHNLGLPHTSSPGDIMFVYAGRTESEQKRWMTLAEGNRLTFQSTQVAAIRATLAKP